MLIVCPNDNMSFVITDSVQNSISHIDTGRTVPAGQAPRGVYFEIEHYDDILNSRILSLKDIFKAKLGWLVGHIYSRVATEDWVPGTLNEDEFHKTIIGFLEELCEWIDDKVLKEARKKIPSDLLKENQDRIRAQIKTIKVSTPRQIVTGKLEEILQRTGLAQEAARSVITSLLNDPEVSLAFRNINV